MNIADQKGSWKDTQEYHQTNHNLFVAQTNSIPALKEHRDWVEKNIFGFGERSFPAMWDMIVAELPVSFTFMEIGVFRGQILSLIELCANRHGKNAKRYGVTPLSSADGHWESDYAADVAKMHDAFNLAKDYTILHGLSTDPLIMKLASQIPVDVLYIDGGHAYEVVKSDIANYCHLVKPGGLLVIDDACCDMQIPMGMFGGIESVTQAVREFLPDKFPDKSLRFEFLFSVVHNRVWRRL